jgi:hypothetical protein
VAPDFVIMALLETASTLCSSTYRLCSACFSSSGSSKYRPHCNG